MKLHHFSRLFFAFILVGCSISKTSSPGLAAIFGGDGRYYLVSDCGIYDLAGAPVRSFPGSQCVFLDDGSLVSYDTSKQELTKYDNLLRKIWSLKLHVHHGIQRTAAGNFIVNSSKFDGDHRQDIILIINQEGKILRRIDIDESFFSNYESVKYYRTQWDKNVSFKSEKTHLASSYEVPTALYGADGLLAEPGDLILTFNAGRYRGVAIARLSGTPVLRNFIPIPFMIHDAQVFDRTQLIFFRNTVKLPPAPENESGLTIYDVAKNSTTKFLNQGSVSYFGGSVQALRDNYFLLTDAGSIYRNPYSPPTENTYSGLRIAQAATMNGRIVLFNPEGEVADEFHFKNNIPAAKLRDVSLFLKNSLPP